jgi:hypothetical protein
MRLAVGVLELVGEPVEPLVQPVAGGGARRLDVPVAVAQRVQAQLVRYFSCIHCVWQILQTNISIIIISLL